MSTPTVRDVDYLLVVNRVRWLAAKARGVAEEIAGYTHRLDQLLDQRLALMGVGACGCNAAMELFGTSVALCPRCDFRTCLGCGHQVHSLTVVACPGCKHVVA